MKELDMLFFFLLTFRAAHLVFEDILIFIYMIRRFGFEFRVRDSIKNSLK